MACDMDSIGVALRRCPFLKAVAEKGGTDYARRIAANPERSASGPCSRRPVLEEEDDFLASFRLFHGTAGVLPLPLACSRFSNGQHTPGQPEAPRQQQHEQPQPQQQQQQPSPCGFSCSKPVEEPGLGSRPSLQGADLPARLQRLPLASMSLPFFGNGPDFSKLFNLGRKPPSARKPPPASSSSSSPTSKPLQPKQPRSSSGRAPPGGRGISVRTGVAATFGGSSAVPAGDAGGCPLRKALGPFAGLIFDSRGHIACPEAITKARAMLAATAPVRSLRPQALGTKLLAVGAVAATLNVPAGAWREHMKKFSFGWFVAVHCTIPFVAMLRKAVIMPPAAIAFTIGAAVLGQFVGARLERQRLLEERLRGEGVLALAAVSQQLALSQAVLTPRTMRASARQQRKEAKCRERAARQGKGAAAERSGAGVVLPGVAA